jgi:hypothetical protein
MCTFRFLRSVVVGLVLATAAPAHAQFTGGVLTREKPTGPARKLSSHLWGLQDRIDTGATLADLAAADPVLENAIVDDKVRVDVRITRFADNDALKTLSEAGLDVTAQYKGLVAGLINPADLDQLAAVDIVTTIHPAYGYWLNAGSVENQADQSLHAAAARATYGIDGTGVKVGILSDSFNSTIGGTISGGILTGSAPQLTGDLPPEIEILDNGSGSDEGAGMAELIYDLAPGCDIAFHTAFESIAGFATGIDELRTQAGCNIIVDDVIWYAEPMFQDGEIAQAAQAAVEAGVPYFSSAGNQADEGYPTTPFATVVQEGLPIHEWAPGVNFVQISFGAGGGLVIAVLQWAEPFSGTLGPGSIVDLDLYLLDSTDLATANTLAAGATDQGEPGNPHSDPVEVLGYIGFGETAYVMVLDWNQYVGQGNGDGTPIRVVYFTAGDVTLDTSEGVGGPTIYGHSAAQDVQAVGAVFYGELDENGAYQDDPGVIDVEPFSSKGGDLPFYFDGSGNPLPGAPVTRFKPQMASVDGTNTTFFGTDDPYDADSYPNFFGTSAAAPHAAAVGALVLDLVDNAFAPAELYGAMIAGALDIVEPGVDAYSGAGIALADSVLDAIAAGIFVTPTTDFESIGFENGPFSVVSRNYTVRNFSGGTVDLSVTKTGDWFDISTGGGSIPSGSSTSVTATLNAGAFSLAAGTYPGSIEFTNLTTGEGDTTRAAMLEVKERVPLPADLDLDAAPEGLVAAIYGDDAEDFLGSENAAVAFGDVNGDGYADAIIGAPEADFTADGTRNAHGQVYVVYGSSTLPFGELADLNTDDLGETGVTRILGGASLDRLGTAVAAADVNEDGIDDIIVGAPGVDAGGSDAGAVYILYGAAGLQTTATIDLNTAPGGAGETRIVGEDNLDSLGEAIAAGDIDGDGRVDLILGAPGAAPPGRSASGEGYIVYGSNDLAGLTLVDLGAPPTEFDLTTIYGDDYLDRLGHHIATGDLNGDGYDDAVFGAPDADRSGAANAGNAYIIYGKADAANTTLIDLDTDGGAVAGVTRIIGASSVDLLGFSVACGDVNADGYDDLLVGAPGVNGTGSPPRPSAGRSYLFYGRDDFHTRSLIDISSPPAAIDLATVTGASDSDFCGWAVAIGDLDGDGYDEAMTSAPNAPASGRSGAGEVYVRFGTDVVLGDLDIRSASPDVTILGDNALDMLGTAMAAPYDADLDGVGDALIAAPEFDHPDLGLDNNTGAGYILFGSSPVTLGTVRQRDRAGDAPPRRFGPTGRCTIDYNGGDAESETAVTIDRAPLEVNPTEGARVRWTIETDRTGWTNETTATFRYTDGDLGLVPENELTVFEAPTTNGPYTQLNVLSHDTDRNTISIKIRPEINGAGLETGETSFRAHFYLIGDAACAGEVTPNDQGFSTVEGTAPASDPLPYALTNVGGLPFGWTMTVEYTPSGSEWLNVSAQSGFLLYDQTTPAIAVPFNGPVVQSLPPGVYTAALTFQSDCDPGFTITRTITLNVQACEWSITDLTDLVSVGPESGPFTPDPFQLRIDNSGDVDIVFHTTLEFDPPVTPGTEWLEAPVNGAVSASGSQTFDADLNNNAEELDPGTYFCTLTLVNDTCVTEPVVRVLELDVLTCEWTANLDGTGYASGIEGGPFANDELAFSIHNTGEADITYSLETSPPAPWLDLPAGGTLPAGQSLNTTASFNAAALALAPGTYTTAIRVISNTCPGSNFVDLPVQLDVLACGLSVKAPASLASEGVEGGPFDPTQFDITLDNTGDVDVSYTATLGSGCLWIDPISSGVVPAGGSVPLTAYINSIANNLPASPTPYACTLTIEDKTCNDVTPVELTFELTVLGCWTVTPAGSLTPSGPAGGPFTPETLGFAVTNNSGSSILVGVDATFDPAFDPADQWLTIPADPVTIVDSGQIDLTINANANDLPASPTPYAATVTFTADGCTEPAVHTIELTVGAPTCNDPPQDTDGDEDVDLTDYGTFLECFNGVNNPYGSGNPACPCLDSEDDGDVDLTDYGEFLSCYNGPNRAPACVAG